MLLFSLFLSITLSFLIVIIFITRRDQEMVKRWLSVGIILAVVFQCVVFFIMANGLLPKFYYLFRIGCPFYYLTPPLIYLYISLILKKERKTLRHYLIHFVPFAISVVDIAWYYANTSATQRISEILAIHEISAAELHLGAGFLPSIIHYYARFIQRGYYLVLQWVLLMKKNAFSKLRSPELNWSLLLTSSQSIIFIGYGYFTAQVFIFDTYKIASAFNASKEISITIMLLGLITICLYLFIHPEILYGALKPNSTPGIKAKIKNSEVGQYDWLPAGANIEAYCSKLEDFMQVEKPFLKRRLPLNFIANGIDVPAHLLSAILNKHYGKSFSDFTNEYRINHILKRIKEDANWDQLTIEGIALEAGFSSRTGFYTAFKKLIGKSPKVYLSELDSQAKAKKKVA